MVASERLINIFIKFYFTPTLAGGLWECQNIPNLNSLVFTETTHQRRLYLTPSASELIIKIVNRKPKNRAFAAVWMALETNAQALFSNSPNIIFQQHLDTIVQKISMIPFWVRN